MQCCLDVDHFVARQNTTFHRFLYPGFNGLDVLARNNSADDRIHEFEAGAGFGRLYLDFRVPVLTAPTGLADKLAHTLGFFANGLAIGDLRAANVCIDAELSLEPVYNDFKMKLSHSADDSLACLLISGDFEARVLGRQAL